MPYRTREQQLQYQRDHYRRNSVLYKRRAAAWNKRQRRVLWHLIQSIKASNPCLDCDTYYPPYVMQFDHVDSDKRINVSCIIKKCWSESLSLMEIGKCQLTCANCHSIRTYSRRSKISNL